MLFKAGTPLRPHFTFTKGLLFHTMLFKAGTPLRPHLTFTKGLLFHTKLFKAGTPLRPHFTFTKGESDRKGAGSEIMSLLKRAT
jgi:hypothetical protein